VREGRQRTDTVCPQKQAEPRTKRRQLKGKKPKEEKKRKNGRVEKRNGINHNLRGQQEGNTQKKKEQEGLNMPGGHQEMVIKAQKKIQKKTKKGKVNKSCHKKG